MDDRKRKVRAYALLRLAYQGGQVEKGCTGCTIPHKVKSQSPETMLDPKNA